MNVKLYVWNLSEDTTEDDLREVFEKVGPIATAVIVKDEETDKSTGLGFVEMESKDDAGQALRKFHEYPLNGQDMVVSFERPDEDRKRHFAPTSYDPKPEQD
jgi:polyadenylate-binding protein